MWHTKINRVHAYNLLNIKTIYMDLSYNKIVTIHPKAFWKSKSNNKTTHTELKYLFLNRNNIKYITSGTFDPLINLERLYLNNNEINNIDNELIVNINKIKVFSISHNKLTQLPIKWLPNSLRQLDIRRNKITNVTDDTFVGAYNLRKIKLSLNNIHIEYNTFRDLTKLTTIEVYPLKLECTCKYIWYLNTKINSRVCDNSNNKYATIREYLKEECKLPG